MMRLSENLRTVADADGGAVLDLCKGKVFRLNPTGATILDLLAHGSTEEQIIHELCRTFGAQAEAATTDVRAFLASLAELQLLQRNPAD